MLAAIIVLIISQAFTVYTAWRQRQYFQEKIRGFESLAVSFITSPTPDKPSPLAQIGDIYADNLAGKLGVTLQAAIRGSTGGSIKAITGSLEEEALAENPILAALPKKLAKNPLAAMGLQAVIQRAMQNQSGIPGVTGPGAPGNGHFQGSHPRFKL